MANKLLPLTPKRKGGRFVPLSRCSFPSMRSENNTPAKLRDIWLPKCQGRPLHEHTTGWTTNSVNGSCFPPAPKLVLQWVRDDSLGVKTVNRKTAHASRGPIHPLQTKNSTFPLCVKQNTQTFHIKMITRSQTFKKRQYKGVLTECLPF